MISVIAVSRFATQRSGRLRTFQVHGQQQLAIVRRQPDHRHGRSKPLNGERELCASPRV